MRDFGPIVRSAAGHAAVRLAELPQGRPVGAQPVGHDHLGHGALPLAEFAQQFQRRFPITSRLDYQLEHLALVVDGAPDIVDPALDSDEDLVQMPAVAGRRASLPDLLGIGGAELERPTADGLVGDIDAAHGEQVLDILVAQGEPKVEQDRMLFDGRRKAMAGVGSGAYARACRAASRAAIRFTCRSRAASLASSRGLTDPRFVRDLPQDLT